MRVLWRQHPKGHADLILSDYLPQPSKAQTPLLSKRTGDRPRLHPSPALDWL